MHINLYRVRLIKAFAVGLLGLAQSAAADDSHAWNFHAYLDNKEIGYHHFTLTHQGTERVLKSEARFAVKLWFINAYRYVHDATERWHGDCLSSMTSSTDDNGKLFSIHAQQNGDQLSVDQGRSHYATTGCSMTFAYWNPNMLLQSHLLNAQTGDYNAVTITSLNNETLKVNGLLLDAKRFHLLGPEIDITLWYSSDGNWLALDSITPTGHHISYRLD